MVSSLVRAHRMNIAFSMFKYVSSYYKNLKTWFFGCVFWGKKYNEKIE